MTINGGSVKGTVRDPRDANGNTLYLAQVHNPNGLPVTVNGRRWNINNSYDALREETTDTDLYMYLPETEPIADVVVGNGPIQRYVLDKEQGRFVNMGVYYPGQVGVGTATYYDPAAGTKKQAENVITVRDGLTTWGYGWYKVEGYVTLDHVDVTGDVNLILSARSSLTVTNSVRVADERSLTIWGSEENFYSDGMLTVRGSGQESDYAAGIGSAGGGGNSQITIHGGNINARGGNGAAGIGSGGSGSSATVNITGGVIRATGGWGGAGIGAGDSGSSATVNISGGVVNANGSYQSAGIGGGSNSNSNATVNINGGVVNATGGTYGAGIGVGNENSRASVTINGGTVTASGGVAAGNRGSVTITGGSIKTDGGVSPQPTNSRGTWVFPLQVDNPSGGTVTVNGTAWNVNNHAAAGDDDTNLYMYLPDSSPTVDVVVSGGPVQRYTLDRDAGRYEPATDNIYYDPATGTMQSCEATAVAADTTDWTGGWYIARDTQSIGTVTVSGDVNLVLVNSRTLTVEGIQIQNGGSLTIWGQSADYTQDGALVAQSGVVSGDSGAVTVRGGKITSAGSEGGAAIGATTITIDRGVVEATSGGSAIVGTTVTINDGSVTATAGTGSAIVGGEVTVNNGTVTATSGDSAAIGAATIAVNNGTVTANGGVAAGSGGTVTIASGTVTAQGDIKADNGAITINSGTVTASGAITGGTVTVAGGSVTADGAITGSGAVTITSGTVAAGGAITGSEVTINSGTVTASGAITGSAVTVNNGTVTANGGIAAGSGGAVTIANGTVTAQGDIKADNGTVTVNNGTVTASGAITGGTVTIAGGTVKPQGDIKADNGPVTINGGVVVAGGAITGSSAVTVSGGTVTAGGAISGGTVTITGGSVKGGITPQPVNAEGQPLYLLQLANPNGEGVIINGAAWNINNHGATGEGDTDLYAYIALSEVVAKVGGGTPIRYILNKDTGLYETASAVNYYDPASGQVQTRDSAEPLVNGTTSWSPDNGTGGWYIALGTVTTRQVTVSGDVNLVLANGAALTVSNGIQVQEGSHLTIWGQNADYTKDGALTAPDASSDYPGIGGASSWITINGGVVTAAGGFNAAGIGTGPSTSATVEINGGLVRAEGGWREDNAGIGGGRDSTSTVTINGGTVQANGYEYAAGIGGGRGSTATVTINGGFVTANGREGAAGIGGGSYHSTAYVTITGGTVTATTTGYYDTGPGIGSGLWTSAASVTITGGSVKGSVNPQPVDANGDPAWLVTVPNSDGLAVTIGDKSWQPRNHAALDNDTSLYAYVSKARADENGVIRVRIDGGERLFVIHNDALLELTEFDQDRASWTWNADGSATLTLPMRDGSEPVTLNGKMTLVSEIPPKCTEEGSRTYKATATINGKEFSDTRPIPVAPLGHAWRGSATWSEDYSQATVTFTCAHDESHQQSVTVDTTSEMTMKPTCGSIGYMTCTADASEKAAELGCETGVFTARKFLPTTAHRWDPEGTVVPLEPGVSGDDVTLTIFCRNEHRHRKIIYPTLEKISATPATCSSEGSETYRMSYEVDGKSYVLADTETYTLPKLPHTWTDWKQVGNNLERECTVCHEKERSDHAHAFVLPNEADWNVVNGQVMSVSVPVKCSACDLSATLTYSGDQIKSNTVTKATCTTDGWTAWSVTVELDGKTRTYTKQTMDPAEGHVWMVDEDDIVWAEDYSAATFTFRCLTCEETAVSRVASTVLDSTPATCEQKGYAVYSASTEYGSTTVSSSVSAELPALGHDWDAEGNQYPLQAGIDGDFVTLTITCKNDTAHTRKVYAELGLVKNEPATCTESGVTGYKMEYELDGQTYAIGEEEDYEIPALGHRYTTAHVCAVCGAKEPTVSPNVTYTWDLPTADDTSRVQWTQPATGAAPYVTVTAVRRGSDGSRFEQPVTVIAAATASTVACDKAGTTSYSAKVEIGGKSATYTKDYADVAPAGHQWSEPEVKWSDDLTSATLTVTCARDETHTQTLTAQVTKTGTAATCESGGQLLYTATAQLPDGVTVKAEKTQSVDPLGHAWALTEDDANPPKLERVDGVLTATLTCRNDPTHTMTVPAQETFVTHVQAATGVADGGDLYRITVTVDGKTYVLAEELRTIPTTAPTVTVANTADGIKLTWTKVEEADTYRVYYREHGGAWHAIGHTANLAYTWKHGKDGTKYEFTVRGCAVSGKTKTLLPGKYNTSATIQFVKAPTVTVKAQQGGIKISWTKVAGADTYRVYYKTAGGSWRAIGHNANLTYTWKHGVAGRTYQFTVRPCTVSGATKTLLGSGYNTSKSVKFIE